MRTFEDEEDKLVEFVYWLVPAAICMAAAVMGAALLLSVLLGTGL